MKLTKKLFAVSMATMMLTAAISLNAFAAQLPITKNLTLPLGAVVPSEEFSFSIAPNTPETTVDDNGLTHYAGVDLGTNDKTSVNSETMEKANDTTYSGTSNVSFDDVEFPAPGVYEYVVTEDLGSTPGMTYASDEYVVYVVVDSNLNVQQIYSLDNNGEKIPVEFANEFTTQKLTVKKTVAGNMGDKNKQFDFSLTLTECKQLPDGSSLEATIARKDGTFSTVTVVVGQTNEFTLADGEELTLENIPAGVEYDVTENDYSADGYTTEVTDSDNGCMNSDDANDGATVEVTNTKNVEVSTGIILNVAPYAIMIMLAVGAGVLFIIKRRKSNEA